jgi:hypothetical protein
MLPVQANDMLPAQTTPARRGDRDELARQLTGLPFPMMTEDLMAVGLQLLLPSRVLGQLDHLPLHMRFYCADDVCDYLAASSRPVLRRA